MERANEEIRAAIQSAHLRHWQVARAAGMNEYCFCRILREELEPEKRNFILSTIRKLSEAEVVHQ